MNGTFIAFLLSFLLIVSATAQTKSDRERANLFGAVRIIKSETIEFSMNEGKIVEGRHIPRQNISFNNEGNKTEDIVYDSQGAILEKIVSTFDAMGRTNGYEEYSSTVDKTSLFLVSIFIR
jgi:hypothetical protein